MYLINFLQVCTFMFLSFIQSFKKFSLAAFELYMYCISKNCVYWLISALFQKYIPNMFCPIFFVDSKNIDSYAFCDSQYKF